MNIGQLSGNVRHTTDREIPAEPGLDAGGIKQEAQDQLDAREREARGREVERIKRLEMDLSLEKQKALAARTLGMIDGQINALSEDETLSGMKFKGQLLELKALHLSGQRSEGQTEAWFVERVGALQAEHHKRRDEAGAAGKLSDLPDVGSKAPDAVGGFGASQYILDMYRAARSEGVQYTFDTGKNLSVEHEAVKDMLAKRPALNRLFQREMASAGPKQRVIPIPMLALEGIPRNRLAETYAADASTRRQPTFRRDMLVEFFRDVDVLDIIGVQSQTIDNDQTYPRLSGSVTASWEAENATVADSSLTVAVATSSPKRIASRDDISWMLLAAADAQFGHVPLVTSEMGRAARELRQVGVFVGTGSSNQPRGVNATTGVTLATVAGTLPTYPELLEMPTVVGNAKIPVNMWWWVTNWTAYKELASILRFGANDDGGTWNSPALRLNETIGDLGAYMASSTGMLVGRPAAFTTAIPANLGGGSNESILLGGIWMYVVDWVYGMGFMTIDDVSLAAAGQTRITINVYCDVGVRLPAAFGRMQEQF